MSTSEAGRALHLVLVEPEIHWNTGNVGRTALALDAQLHLVHPLGFSLDDKNLKRAGLDYWPRVRVSEWPSWPAFAEVLPSLGASYFFSARATRSYWDVRYPDRCVLIFGRESVGLPTPLLNEHSARTVALPIVDEAIRSLNLSTAVAVAAYEVARQWRG